MIKSKNGITLVALIITIIVLLILAVTTIQIIQTNDIINYGEEAVVTYDKEEIEEKIRLAILPALIEGKGKIKGDKAFKILNNGLKEIGYLGDYIEELPVLVIIGNNEYIIEEDGTIKKATDIYKLKILETTIAGEKKTLEDENGDSITIPIGFKVAKDSPILVKEGIVVIAPDGSEFVWVPVEDINTMYGTNLAGEKLGKLYEWDTDGKIKNLNWIEKNGIMSVQSTWNNVEPSYLTGGLYADASERGLKYLNTIVGIPGVVGEDNDEMLAQWKTQLQNEFNEMIKYVGQHKGFYIGRYETSLNDEGVAQAKGKETAITSRTSSTWYGLYQREKEYSNIEKLNDVVGSSMIWGCQYDQMLIWLQNNGIDVTATDSKSLNGAEKNNNSITTGIEGDKDILNNIYDLLGCHNEWTLEMVPQNSRVYRSGRYDISETLSNRKTDIPIRTYNYYSSRIALYVK